MITWVNWRSGVGFDAELIQCPVIHADPEEEMIEFSGLIIRLPLLEIAIGVEVE